MPKPSDPHVEKLQQLVLTAGGPAEFARKYSQDGADKPIDATYVSQILNGHRAFGDKARRNMARRAGMDENYFEAWQGVAQNSVVYHLWPALVTQIAEIARELPEHLQHQLLGQAKMLQAEFRIMPKTHRARRPVIPHQARGGWDTTKVILLAHWKTRSIGKIDHESAP